MLDLHTTIAEQAMRTSPATLKWAVAIMLAVFFGAVLGGLHMYQAYNRTWGLKLVVGLILLVLLSGVIASLPFVLDIAYGLGLAWVWLVWTLTGRWSRRWNGSAWWRHLMRGLCCALFPGSLLVLGRTECMVLETFFLPYPPSEGQQNGLVFWLLYGLPGAVWAGVAATALSLVLSQRAAGVPWGQLWSSRRRRAGLAAGLLALILGANWYTAGRLDFSQAVAKGHAGRVGYVVFSRPGSVHLARCGWTALSWAAFFDHEAVVKVLLEAGANVNARNGLGSTPLDWAAMHNNLRLVKLLLAAGAELNAGRDQYPSPLHYAAGNGHVEVAEMLLAAGAEVNAKDDQGWTPLHSAASRGAADMAKTLVVAGAHVSARDKGGRMPLHTAASLVHGGVLRVLLDAGGEINAKDNTGQTVLDRALAPEERVTPEMAQACAALLRQAGGKTGAELDAEKATPAQEPGKPLEPGQ